LARIPADPQKSSANVSLKSPGEAEAPKNPPSPLAVIIVRVAMLKFFGVYIFDILYLGLFIMLLIWSFVKLGTSIIDYNPILLNAKLNMSLMSAWVISASVFMIPFVAGLRDIVSNIRNSSYSIYYNPWKWLDAIYVITPLFVVEYTFGAAIFPRIPFSIGGGQAREIEIFTSHNTAEFSMERLFLIGESSQSIFVLAFDNYGHSALQINNGEISYTRSKEK